MELILKEDVQNLGFKDDLVSVKNGYGRNFLIPQGLAAMATPSAKKVLAENLKISGIVQFLGAVSSDETHLIYVDHDIFILPSRNEAWALVVNEALSSGLPVVIPYWVGAVPDLVIQGYTGFVMEDNEPETISRAIQKVIQTDSKKLFQQGKSVQKIKDFIDIKYSRYGTGTSTPKP